MPHIEIKYRLASEFNVQALAKALHERLAREDGITESEIKTSALPLAQSVVGAQYTNPDGNMIRVTLAVWDKPERTDDVLARWVENLADVVEEHVPDKTPVAVTFEARRINPATYVSRTYPLEAAP